jgi:hypothetical protein
MALKHSMNGQRGRGAWVCGAGLWPIHIDRTGFRFGGYSKWNGGSPYYSLLEGEAFLLTLVYI